MRIIILGMIYLNIRRRLKLYSLVKKALYQVTSTLVRLFLVIIKLGQNICLTAIHTQ